MRDTRALYTPTFWLACAIHFTGGMSFGMFLLFPLFIDSLGGDEIRIGLVLGTGIAASVVLRPTVGALLDRLGRRQVLLWSGAINAARRTGHTIAVSRPVDIVKSRFAATRIA